MISTDPPYYDNIGYADLSDFFYVWLRRSLKPVFPELFTTLAVPKTEELVATPYRHDSREAAEAFFLNGMTQAMRRLSEQAHPGFPVTIYYAFKQSERKSDAGTSSTGWETFLDAVIRSGFAITGTWPMRTELGNRMIGMGTNALASSIVLVCRRRPADAPAATRRECVTAIRAELPPALRLLQTGNVAPVDLAQAAIGPGMAVYTRYARALSVVAAESNEPADHRHAARVWTYAANATTDPWQAQRPVARTPPRAAGVAVVPGPFQPQRTQHAPEGLRAAADVARRPSAGAGRRRAVVVAVVRVQPLLHRPRGEGEHRAADRLLERFEILLVGRARGYERVDLRADLVGERFRKAPFFAAPAVCSEPATRRASLSAVLTATSSFDNRRKRRCSAIRARVSASACAGMMRVTVLPFSFASTTGPDRAPDRQDDPAHLYPRTTVPHFLTCTPQQRRT